MSDKWHLKTKPTVFGHFTFDTFASYVGSF